MYHLSRNTWNILARWHRGNIVKANNGAPLRGTWAAGMPSSGTWPIYGNDEGFRSFAKLLVKLQVLLDILGCTQNFLGQAIFCWPWASYFILNPCFWSNHRVCCSKKGSTLSRFCMSVSVGEFPSDIALKSSPLNEATSFSPEISYFDVYILVPSAFFRGLNLVWISRFFSPLLVNSELFFARDAALLWPLWCERRRGESGGPTGPGGEATLTIW